MKISKERLVSIFAILLIAVFISFMAFELYTSYMNIKSCENIDTSGEIEVVFNSNVTISEAYAVINSTGGEIVEQEYYYIGNTSDSLEKTIYFVIKVGPGEEEHYIEIYKENPEVYNAYKPKITC